MTARQAASSFHTNRPRAAVDKSPSASNRLAADQVDHREFEDITEQIRDPDQPAQQPRYPGHNREHKGRVIALIHPARLIQPHHGQNQRRHNRKQSGRGNYGQNHGHNHKKLPDKNSV